MFRSLLDLVAPPRCLACGVRAPLPWCPICEARAVPADAPDRCRVCAGWHAGRCPLQDSGIRSTVAAYAYTGVVADAVVAAKVAGATAAWPGLGDRLASALPGGLTADVVVAVPTEPRRRRQRGVDHARVLADAVGRRLAAPVVTALRARAGNPDRGRGSDRAGPVPAPVITASGRDPDRLGGARVLLVDDVLTTGATVTAAAAALRSVGVDTIDVAVLARAQH